MSVALVGLLTQVSPVFAQATSEAAMMQVVRESNRCLLEETDRRVGGVTALSDADRRSTRMAVADACYEYNERLAAFSAEVRNGSKTAKEVGERFLADSLQIADAAITTRLKANLEEKSP